MVRRKVMSTGKKIDGEIVKVQEYDHRYAVYERVI